MRIARYFCLACLAAVWSGPVTAQTPQFDGTWSVTLLCPRSPDGALPFTFVFSASIRDGTLHSENGVVGHPGWMALDGTIKPDGSAALMAQGLTGLTQYNVNQTQRGVPYRHPVTAHFDGARGDGTWVTTRICNFTFTRQ